MFFEGLLRIRIFVCCDIVIFAIIDNLLIYFLVLFSLSSF